MMHKTLLLCMVVSATNALPNYLFARQGITAKISPSAPPPSGCATDLPGSFGIAVLSLPTGGAAPAQTAAISTIGDGQRSLSSPPNPYLNHTDSKIAQASTKGAAVAPITQIGDGQLQGATSVVSVGRISMISDGQIQAPTVHAAMTVQPVTQISDGQVQAPKSTAAPVSQISDGQIQAPKSTAAPISQISDGQIQAPKSTVAPVAQITDGQVQAPKATASPVNQISDGQVQNAKSTAPAVSQITDGQVQAPKSTASAVSQISDHQIQAPTGSAGSGSSSSSSSGGLVACAENGTLSLTLSGSVLLDSQGRTGYIAANEQLQFDKPAQTGALLTAGFSVCSNGSLALGGSAVFYQCLSGSFYNLYDKAIAAQCVPVLIQTLTLQQC